MSKKGEKARITIHDIAQKLNITASTVSRALNGSPKISLATKKLVAKTAQALGYQPNQLASALRKGKSHLIGVIIPTADRTFFASVVRGIEEIAHRLDYKVIITQTNDDFEKEVQTVDALLQARVDGIIASVGVNTAKYHHFQQAKERGIPVILFDRTTHELEVSQVVIDDYLGAYKAVAHLIQQGCRRIAHFTSLKKISIFRERMRGYTDALQQHGIAFDESLVVKSSLQLEDGRRCMEELLMLDHRPDAVFSASDYGAVGAMQVLKEKNIKIPQEVALVGFSNEAFTSFTDPPLSTIDQFSLQMGNAAAKLFFDQLHSKAKKQLYHKTVLKPALIVRQSSLKKERISSSVK